MHLGILTGGGDVPGLNVVIKTVVREAFQRGWRVTGFRRGWSGPLNLEPGVPGSLAEWTMTLTPELVRTIDRTGGTMLHSSRTNPGKVKRKDVPAFLAGSLKADVNDATAHVLGVLAHLKLDALIAIGGDDTLSYAGRLHREGAKVIAIPKTMDNDVYGTDYCIGFSTAVTRSVDAITALRTSAGSHERIAVIELFGRNSGETALMAGLLADADRTLIAEAPADAARLASLLKEDRARNPSRYAICVVSEGAQLSGGAVIESGEADAYGHRKLGGIGEIVGAEIKRRTGIDIINQSLAYMMRSGPPDALDRIVASAYALMAVDLIARGQSGLMTALQNGRYTAVPADISISGLRRVNVARMYDTEAYRPRIKGIEGRSMLLG